MYVPWRDSKLTRLLKDRFVWLTSMIGWQRKFFFQLERLCLYCDDCKCVASFFTGAHFIVVILSIVASLTKLGKRFSTPTELQTSKSTSCSNYASGGFTLKRREFSDLRRRRWFASRMQELHNLEQMQDSILKKTPQCVSLPTPYYWITLLGVSYFQKKQSKHVLYNFSPIPDLIVVQQAGDLPSCEYTMWWLWRLFLTDRLHCRSPLRRRQSSTAAPVCDCVGESCLKIISK